MVSVFKEKIMALIAGWDCFSPDAGTVESKDCPTCGESMSVKRNCKGPRGFAANMAHLSDAANMDSPREYDLYDFFQCENAEKEWHCQVRELKQLAKETPSPTLVKIYAEDAKEILRMAAFSYNDIGSEIKNA